MTFLSRRARDFETLPALTGPSRSSPKLQRTAPVANSSELESTGLHRRGQPPPPPPSGRLGAANSEYLTGSMRVAVAAASRTRIKPPARPVFRGSRRSSSSAPAALLAVCHARRQPRCRPRRDRREAERRRGDQYLARPRPRAVSRTSHGRQAMFMLRGARASRSTRWRRACAHSSTVSAGRRPRATSSSWLVVNRRRRRGGRAPWRRLRAARTSDGRRSRQARQQGPRSSTSPPRHVAAAPSPAPPRV